MWAWWCLPDDDLGLVLRSPWDVDKWGGCPLTCPKGGRGNEKEAWRSFLTPLPALKCYERCCPVRRSPPGNT